MLAILLIDLWILNNEFLSLTKKKNFESQFIKSTVIDHIIEDNSNFRVFFTFIYSFNSAICNYVGIRKKNKQ